MASYANEVRLFGKWSYEGINLGDISLEDFVAVKSKDMVYLPHTAGRYQVKRFRKALCPIVERLCNSLMRKGRNNGKKLLAVRIVQQAFEIIREFLFAGPPLSWLFLLLIRSSLLLRSVSSFDLCRPPH